MNPAHLYWIPRVIDLLRKAGAADSQIAYLSFYKGQLTMMRHYDMPQLRQGTVDASQGREYPFVIVDIVTPGGTQYPLGFATDVRRIYVGLSRAQNGLIMFGSSDVRYQNVGARTWKNLINDHIQHGALRTMPMPPITDLEVEFDIPGRFWERVLPFGGI